MRPIPPALRNQLAADPFFARCARWREGNCDGRITWEHAIIYAGRQVNERWAIIPLCAYHHAVDDHQDGGDLDKDLNVLIALSRAEPSELEKYPKRDWLFEYARLRKRYPNYQL